MPHKPKQKPSALYGVYSKFLHLDMFAQSPSFEVGGKRYYRTLMGSIMSILIFIIITPYVAKRYSVLVNYKDTRYSTSNRQNKFINEHNTIDNGITLEEADFKMAYKIEVFGDDLCDDDGCTVLDQNDEPLWKRYVDVGLKYRWW